jgi:hypothetical protein
VELTQKVLKMGFGVRYIETSDYTARVLVCLLKSTAFFYKKNTSTTDEIQAGLFSDTILLMFTAAKTCMPDRLT